MVEILGIVLVVVQIAYYALGSAHTAAKYRRLKRGDAGRQNQEDR